MRVLPVLVLLTLLAGCAREQSPQAAYRALLAAVAKRDADQTWSLLSRSSRELLDARARAAAAAQAPGVAAPSGKDLLFGDATQLSAPVSSVTVASETADRAVLRVEVEGAPPAEVTLVREGGWRVVLPGTPGP